MRRSLAHRKIESPFLLSNLKCIKTSGKHRKNYSESIQCSGFLWYWKRKEKKKTLSISKGQKKMDSAVNIMGRKEPPSIHRRGLDPTANGRHEALSSSLLNPLCWRGCAEAFSHWRARVPITSSKPCSVSGHCMWRRAWLADCLDPRRREREEPMTCSDRLCLAESWFRASIFVPWCSLP